METKIVIRELGSFKMTNSAIEEIENTLNEYKKNGYKIKSSNITTINNIKYTFYFLLEKD